MTKHQNKHVYIGMTICRVRGFLLTVGRHKEACVDLSGVAEVRLQFLPTGFKFPLMDACGFDVQYVETYLPFRQT